MSDALTSLRRHMPEWMANKGTALLDALPQEVERWVQSTARQVEAMPGPPDHDAWHGEIVEHFGKGRNKSEQEAIVAALSCAVLLVAIQQLPPPMLIPGEGPAVPTHTKTTELDRRSVKRSRMLGLLERGLQAAGDSPSTVVGGLGG